jgi:hypothetical protein
MAKSMKLGGGGRFAKVSAAAGGGAKGAAIAAAVGRKKYGKAKFQKLAVKGKKRANKGYNFQKAEKRLGVVNS